MIRSNLITIVINNLYSRCTSYCSIVNAISPEVVVAANWVVSDSAVSCSSQTRFCVVSCSRSLKLLVVEYLNIRSCYTTSSRSLVQSKIHATLLEHVHPESLACPFVVVVSHATYGTCTTGLNLRRSNAETDLLFRYVLLAISTESVII